MRAAVLLVLAVAPPAGMPPRETIGVYRGWAAFRDAGRCYAIARPVIAGAAAARAPFASVGTWPGRGVRASFQIRLSTLPSRTAAVTLSIGERRFVLVASGVDAWPADRASDRALVAALRSARSMSVEAVSARGRPFADSYALAGAATAIDAATLGCVGQGG